MDSNFLNAKGVPSTIIYGKINEEWYHCWEEIYNPKTNKTYIRDATGNIGGWEINQFPKRINGKYIEFKKGVTAKDLKEFTNIKKVYWENIPEKYKPFFKLKMRQKNKK